MTALEQQWKTYRNACYGPGPIPTLQESETRQAFYAGCLVVLKLAVESVAGLPADEANQQISAMIKDAQDVCRQRIYEMRGRN